VKKITYTGGSDATQCCVQSQFAHKNSHTLEAKITKFEDSFSMSNNNNFYILLGPVLQDVQNLTPGKGLSQKHTQHTTLTWEQETKL